MLSFKTKRCSNKNDLGMYKIQKNEAFRAKIVKPELNLVSYR